MNSKVAEIEAALTKLNSYPTGDYRRWPVPSYLDGEIADIVLEYSNLAEMGRSEVRQLANTPHRTALLLAFAERMMGIGIDKQSEAGLYVAAVALMIEDFHDISGEGKRLLTRLTDEAARFVAEPKLFRARVRGLASLQMAHYLDQFFATATAAGQRLVA